MGVGVNALQAVQDDRSHTVAAPDARARLELYLGGAAGASRVRIDEMSLLSGGAIQENWAIAVTVDDGPYAGARRWVLRTDSPSAVPVSLDRLQECAVLRVAYGAGVRVPRPLWACRDRTVIGRDFFVMERMSGVAAGHRVTRDPSLASGGAGLAGELGATLARLHAVVPPRSELDFLRLPARHPALETIDDYRGYLDALDVGYPVLEFGLRWCELHVPSDWVVTLIHRDFRTGNYLVDDGHLTGVLDWEFAGWGDPREDLGWFTARCWRFAGVRREAGGIADLEPFLCGYADAGGAPVRADELRYWQVMAHLRWAVIALQQAQRHLSGSQASLELALTGRLVADLEHEIMHLTGDGDA